MRRGWLTGCVASLTTVVTGVAVGAEPPRGLVLDASAGVPKLERSSTEVVGGGVAGWDAASWSAVGRGSFAAYDFKGPGGLQQGERAEGSVEGAARLGLAPRLRLDLALTLGVASYDTTTITAVRPLQDESSLMLRGTAHAGVRWDAGGSFAYAQAGAGLQSEDHTQTTVVVSSGATVALDDSTARTLRLVARAGGRWAAVPGVLAMRLRADVATSTIRRDTASVQVTATGSTSVVETGALERQRQLELESRLFVDVDALGFVGVVPAVFAGVDVVRASSSTATLSATVPVVGVGLFAAPR